MNIQSAVNTIKGNSPFNKKKKNQEFVCKVHKH